MISFKQNMLFLCIGTTCSAPNTGGEGGEGQNPQNPGNGGQNPTTQNPENPGNGGQNLTTENPGNSGNGRRSQAFQLAYPHWVQALPIFFALLRW